MCLQRHMRDAGAGEGIGGGCIVLVLIGMSHQFSIIMHDDSDDAHGVEIRAPLLLPPPPPPFLPPLPSSLLLASYTTCHCHLSSMV